MSPRIRYADDLERECRTPHGSHACVKDTDHTNDPTNDDHQCCCGEAWEDE